MWLIKDIHVIFTHFICHAYTSPNEQAKGHLKIVYMSSQFWPNFCAVKCTNFQMLLCDHLKSYGLDILPYNNTDDQTLVSEMDFDTDLDLDLPLNTSLKPPDSVNSTASPCSCSPSFLVPMATQVLTANI